MIDIRKRLEPFLQEIEDFHTENMEDIEEYRNCRRGFIKILAENGIEFVNEPYGDGLPTTEASFKTLMDAYMRLQIDEKMECMRKSYLGVHDD